MKTVGGAQAYPDLVGDRSPQLVGDLDQRRVQLLEAAATKAVVDRPVGLVERAPGRHHGVLDVGGASVGCRAHDPLGRRVHVVEPLSRSGLGELTVDQ